MPLYQEGSRSSRIVLVGESPGKQEVERGRPFVGGSGQLLDKFLSKAKIGRNECFITNVCHVRPPDDDFEWFLRQANQAHLIKGIIQLKADLDEIRPNIVVALGAKPLEILTGKVGIDKWRGSILPSTLVKGLKVVGTYHPAFCLRNYDYGAVAAMDLGRVHEESNTPHINLPPRRIILPDGEWTRSGLDVTTWSWVDRKWNLESHVAALVSAGEYSVDIECVPTDSGWKLACIGFAASPDTALVIPATEGRNLHVIKLLLENDCRKVYQNGTFDVTVLLDTGIQPRNFWWDTMIAQHILYAECAGAPDEVSKLNPDRKRQAAIGKGLAFLTSINTKEPFYKDDGKIIGHGGDTRIYYRYNGLDCCTTIESRIQQELDLRSFGVYDQFRQRMELVDPLIEATRLGIRIDVPRRTQMLEEVRAKERLLQAVLDTAAGHPVNVSSNPQVTRLLYDELKLPVKRGKGKTAGRTANADAIEELVGKYPGVPALRAILHIREQRVLRERYLDTTIDADSRMRCSLDITGTRSYRLSSRASIYGSGTNLQNQPEYIRECFIADPGTVLLAPDYSQAEAVVVSYLSEDEWLQRIFADPTRDLHRETAAVIFNKAPEDVTSAERFLGKKARHALNYGMNAKRFVEVIASDSETTGIRITIQQAQRIIDGFFMLHPNHKSVYWKGIERELAETRTLVNCWGYKRTFFGRWDDNMLRDAYSWKPQSALGILGCLAWGAVSQSIRPLDGRVLLNVHDSLVIQVPLENVESAARITQQAMDIPLTVKGHTFTIRTDMKVGYNWGNREVDKKTGTVKNPNGLRKLSEFLENPERT
jgi:uracil-DNA glycosylase family 4